MKMSQVKKGKVISYIQNGTNVDEIHCIDSIFAPMSRWSQYKRFKIKQRQPNFVDIAFLVPIDRYDTGASFGHVIKSLTVP